MLFLVSQSHDRNRHLGDSRKSFQAKTKKMKLPVSFAWGLFFESPMNKLQDVMELSTKTCWAYPYDQNTTLYAHLFQRNGQLLFWMFLQRQHGDE